MLEQILTDMYVDPDLLSELDEEQKQVLFCKMREEQLRRWNEKEAELEKSEKKKPPRKNSRKIDFQLGSDGEPWVWVMGDHPDDLSIEDILEQEAQYEALKQAEIEAEALRKTKEAELLRLQQENEERIKREKKEKEERLKRKAAEAAAHHSRQEALQVEEERKQQEQEEKKALEEVKMRSEKLRKISLTEMEKKKNRRSSQIFIDFKQTRDMFIKQAEDNSKQIDDAWQEQEKKSKQVDNERRQIARKAREEHRRSLKSKFKTESMIVGMLSKSLQSNRDGKENVKPPMATRPVQGSRPTNKAAVREWFRDQEEPRGAGLDSKTQQVAPWFHEPPNQPAQPPSVPVKASTQPVNDPAEIVRPSTQPAKSRPKSTLPAWPPTPSEPSSSSSRESEC